MKTIPGEELTILFAPEAQAQIDADPELASAVKDFAAMMRQVYQDVHDGKYASLDEAMEAIGAEPFDEI
jgi:hypothetical protein